MPKPRAMCVSAARVGGRIEVLRLCGRPRAGVELGSTGTHTRTRPSAGIRDRPVQALSLPGRHARSVVAWTSSSCTRRPFAQGLIAKIPCTRPLASHQLRPQCHGHHDVPARAPLPERLRLRRALIIFAKDKELTKKIHPRMLGDFRRSLPLKAARWRAHTDRQDAAAASSRGSNRPGPTSARCLSECRPAPRPR